MGRPRGSQDKQKRKHRDTWKPGEEEILRSHYGQGILTCKQIAILLNKSKDSIRHKVRELLLRKLSCKYNFSLNDAHNLNNICGVYALYNIVTQMYYVGSSIDIGSRLYTHFIQLNNGTHDNKKLQLEWNKDNFRILLLKECPYIELIKTEEYFMSLLNIQLYNTWKTHKCLPAPCMIEKRFWQSIHKLEEDKCWIWLKRTTKDGYGCFQYMETEYMAHRIAYWLYYNINPNGYIVRHSCNNKLCCNPNHLKLGSNMDNMNDLYGETIRVRKQLSPFGFGKHSSLEPHKEEIQKLRLEGKSFVEIGNIYNLRGNAIYMFIRKNFPKLVFIDNVDSSVRPKKLPKLVRGILITAFNETKTIPNWLIDKRCCVSESVLRMRLYKGWKSEEAISTPKRNNQKLDEEQIKQILMLSTSGKTQKEVGASFGVSGPTIGKIWKNKNSH